MLRWQRHSHRETTATHPANTSISAPSTSAQPFWQVRARILARRDGSPAQCRTPTAHCGASEARMVIAYRRYAVDDDSPLYGWRRDRWSGGGGGEHQPAAGPGLSGVLGIAVFGSHGGAAQRGAATLRSGTVEAGEGGQLRFEIPPLLRNFGVEHGIDLASQGAHESSPAAYAAGLLIVDVPVRKT
jgi:hypothetical protein